MGPDAAGDPGQLGSGDGARGGDGVLLAAIGGTGRAGRPAPVIVRCSPGARRGRPGGRAPRGRPARGRGRGRRARDAEGRGREGLRLAGRAHGGRRPGLAVGLLRGRPGDRRGREDAPRLRLLRRASEVGHADRDRAGEQHVARVQRLRWTEPLHRRHAGLHATTDGGRLPLQASRQGSARDGDRGARPAERRARRVHHPQPPVGLRRLRGLARLGAAVHPVG